MVLESLTCSISRHKRKHRRSIFHKTYSLLPPSAEADAAQSYIKPDPTQETPAPRALRACPSFRSTTLEPKGGIESFSVDVSRLPCPERSMDMGAYLPVNRAARGGRRRRKDGSATPKGGARHAGCNPGLPFSFRRSAEERDEG